MHSGVDKPVRVLLRGRRSPRDPLAVVVEAVGRTVIREIREPDGRVSPLLNRARAPLPPIRVATQPGDIELTLIPAPASAAIIRVSTFNDAFASP
jgi:hypothetical protein